VGIYLHHGQTVETGVRLFKEFYWTPFVLGGIAFIPLFVTRFRSPGAIILAGVFWTAAGAVSLDYEICLAI